MLLLLQERPLLPSLLLLLEMMLPLLMLLGRGLMRVLLPVVAWPRPLLLLLLLAVVGPAFVVLGGPLLLLPGGRLSKLVTESAEIARGASASRGGGARRAT